MVIPYKELLNLQIKICTKNHNLYMALKGLERLFGNCFGHDDYIYQELNNIIKSHTGNWLMVKNLSSFLINYYSKKQLPR